MFQKLTSPRQVRGFFNFYANIAPQLLFYMNLRAKQKLADILCIICFCVFLALVLVRITRMFIFHIEIENLYPWVTVGIAIFFVLGWVFLGTSIDQKNKNEKG